MGRHGAPPPRESVPTGTRLRAALTTWAERLVLGLAAGGGTWAVLHWAGTASATALWAAGVVAVTVLVATWAASTLPGHDTHVHESHVHDTHPHDAGSDPNDVRR